MYEGQIAAVIAFFDLVNGDDIEIKNIKNIIKKKLCEAQF